MASSKKWQTAKYKQAVSKAQAKAAGWVYSKRKIASEDAALYKEIFKMLNPELLKSPEAKRELRQWI